MKLKNVKNILSMKDIEIENYIFSKTKEFYADIENLSFLKL